jgi:hypothetical protein
MELFLRSSIDPRVSSSRFSNFADWARRVYVMKNNSSKLILLMFCVVSALLLISCAKTDLTTNRADSSASPAASPAATTTTATASTGEIGVPECDSFIKAYEACVKDKVPAMVRPTFDSTLATWRKTWKEQAANPQTKAAMATACKQAQEQAKTSMKAYNCTF